MTNSSYYEVGKRKWVIARSTRFGMEQSWGNSSEQLIPLPERLYAGGAQSHRGFAINQAGPRDEQTGFPIGGAGVFVNTLELRLPNPTLPYVGNSLGFVLFHDMGNVFNSVSDIGPSFLRFHQPDMATCKDTSTPPPESPVVTNGKCSFNYFSHAVGVGLRYNTPIGPIRFDFAVNLDPSVYPVFVTYSSSSTMIPTQPYHTNTGYFKFLLQHRAEFLMRRADLKRGSVRWLAAAMFAAGLAGAGADCALGRCALQRCAFRAATGSAGQCNRGYQWRCVAAKRSADGNRDGGAGAVEPSTREKP